MSSTHINLYNYGKPFGIQPEQKKEEIPLTIRSAIEDIISQEGCIYEDMEVSGTRIRVNAFGIQNRNFDNKDYERSSKEAAKRVMEKIQSFPEVLNIRYNYGYPYYELVINFKGTPHKSELRREQTYEPFIKFIEKHFQCKLTEGDIIVETKMLTMVIKEIVTGYTYLGGVWQLKTKTIDTNEERSWTKSQIKYFKFKKEGSR
jgi:hypothetical protein